MRYGNLNLLWLLWLLPVCTFFFVWAFKRKQKLILKFVSKELRDRLLEGVSFKKQHFKAFVLLLTIFFIIVALIRPKWGFHWQEVKRKGVDIIVALDVSKSMLAEDVSPNRLQRAKREIVDLLELIQGDRVGLIAFAGTSFLQSPLTLDYGAVQIFLDDLSSDLIPIPGTAIGQAIETAIKSFDQKDKKSRVLILITDGEDHQGKPVEVAKKAEEQKITIYTIGIGKKDGAPIPDSRGGFKKDKNGELILTHLDEGTLQKIALNTGGSYVRSVTGDLDLEKIYEDIRKSVEQKDLKSGRRKRYEERYQWPLFIAIVLLVFEIFYSERRGRRKKKIKSVNFTFILLFLISANILAADIEFLYNDGSYDEALKELIDKQIVDPENLDIKYNLGNSYYKMKQYEKAQKLFMSTAINGENELSQKSYYNLGNVAYKTGKLQEAITFYQKAIDLKLDDEDAKYNLEFVRKEIKRRLEEQKKRKQQQKKQQDKQQKQGDKKQQQDQQKKEDQKKKEEQKNKKGDEKQKDKKDEQKKQGAAAKKDSKKDKKEMSKEEAQQWLSTLKDARKEYLKKKMKSGRSYQVEKDW